MLMKIRSRMIAEQSAAIKTEFVDLCFAENNSPIILGIRLIGNDTENRIEAALIGVLDYADESNRSIADSIASECDNFGSVVSVVFV